MFDYDRSNFIAFLNKFPKQIPESLALMKKFSPDLDVSGVRHIVVAGMGGSAIAGDLLLNYLREELKIPAAVNRDYSIPAFVDEHTLFMAVSYSGNTEETIAATHSARQRSARIVTLSSGGDLETLSREQGFPHIKVPGNLPPRQALGYLFFPLLLLFEKLGLVGSKSEEIAETKALLAGLSERFNPEKSFGNNLANHIAQSIYHAIALTYVGADYLRAVPIRWRNQFNENSKVLAFSNVFPELNHNEIMGFEGLPEVNQHFRVILLREPDEHPRIKKRIAVTKEILRNKKILFGEIFAEGESRLARLFSLIYIGDWASYYLAMHNEKDPIAIDSINFLKKKLSEVPA